MSLTTSALPATVTPLGYASVRAVGALPSVPDCASSFAAESVKLLLAEDHVGNGAVD